MVKRLIDRRPLVPPVPAVSLVPAVGSASAVVPAASATLASPATALLPRFVVPPGPAFIAMPPPRVAATLPGGIGRVPATLGRLGMAVTVAVALAVTSAVFRTLFPAVGPSVRGGGLGRFCRARRCDFVAQLRKNSLQHIK